MKTGNGCCAGHHRCCLVPYCPRGITTIIHVVEKLLFFVCVHAAPESVVSHGTQFSFSDETLERFFNQFFAVLHVVKYGLVKNEVPTVHPCVSLSNFFDALDDAQRERSSVWLQADVNWSVAVIRVGDNGPGVTPEIRAHMFERDFTTKGERGSGIGLSVVHQMVRNLGGDIDVVSDPGRGTVVTVALPIR